MVVLGKVVLGMVLLGSVSVPVELVPYMISMTTLQPLPLLCRQCHIIELVVSAALL
jgi:hypothetical protein